MRVLFLAAAFLLAAPAFANEDDDFNPLSIAIEDAINCHIDARTYNALAWQLDDDAVGWRARGWKPVKSDNPFLAEYRLREAVSIAGIMTDRIAFNASGIFAVLDLADPSALAAKEEIPNLADSGTAYEALGIPSGMAANLPKTHRFLGERVLVDETERDEALNLVFKTRIKRTLSTVSSHPGKTLYGCDYKIEMEELGAETQLAP